MTTDELVRKFALKDYPHWILSLHTNQSYLGRAVVWCKRADALELSDATDEELLELRDILAEYKRILQEQFDVSWMNFAFLGNVDRHLHGHIIPRYDGPRKFAGQTFTDEEWGNHYAREKGIPILEPDKTVTEIKTVLTEHLAASH